MNFGDLFLKSIDEGLSVFGEDCKENFYQVLERNFMLKKQEIPFMIEEFSVALKKTFGFNAYYLEILIMRYLFTKLEKKVVYMDDIDSFNFVNYIISVKKLNEFKLLEPLVQ